MSADLCNYNGEASEEVMQSQSLANRFERLPYEPDLLLYSER